MTTVVYVVAQGKKELERRVLRVDDGHDDAEVVFTMTSALAALLDAGELDVAVGFMRGDIKMSGDYAALLSVLPRLRPQPAR